MWLRRDFHNGLLSYRRFQFCGPGLTGSLFQKWGRSLEDRGGPRFLSWIPAEAGPLRLLLRGPSLSGGADGPPGLRGVWSRWLLWAALLDRPEPARSGSQQEMPQRPGV